MKKILMIIILCFFITGCTESEDKISTYLSNEEMREIMNQNEYLIIDVRTKEEYDELHVVDSINIPYDEITEEKLDKRKIIFVYCRSGKRSSIAYETLKKAGYNVYDLGSIENIDLSKE